MESFSGRKRSVQFEFAPQRFPFDHDSFLWFYYCEDEFQGIGTYSHSIVFQQGIAPLVLHPFQPQIEYADDDDDDETRK